VDVFVEDQNACKAAWAVHVMEKFVSRDWLFLDTSWISEKKSNLIEFGRDNLGNKSYTED